MDANEASAPPHLQLDDLVSATADVQLGARVQPTDGFSSIADEPSTVVKSAYRNSFQRVKNKLTDASLRTRSKIQVLETDIVSQNYHNLEPIQLLGSDLNVGARAAPAEASKLQAMVGMLLFFIALGITSAPLFDRSIDAEKLLDNSGLLIKKNASYAKAYFMGSGFFDAFTTKMKSNVTSVNWYPQPADTKFLNFSYMNQAKFTGGPCSILDTSNSSAPECIMMTGHQGGVSAYGLCRNGSEFLSVQYVQALVTPADVGGLVSAGTWIENSRESILVGLLSPPTCENGKKVVIKPNVTDVRLMSGPFVRVAKGPTNQWYDVMDLPVPVRARMFYMAAKEGTGQGLTLPSKKRQSFDDVIAQNAFGSTLADKLEIAAPFAESKYVFVTLYRIAGADITLPRLQFTFAVAAQALALLIFVLIIAVRNGPLNTYHVVHQLLRLPTFCIISIQLLYVLYYQIFDIGYVNSNDALRHIYDKKVVYVSGVGFILLHQLDVRAAVTLWPKMANNDSYYFTRIVWMLGSLAIFLWSLSVNDSAHYVVATSSTCSLGASECNKSKFFFMQHYVCLAVFLAHPIAYGLIQLVQWRLNLHEYTHDNRQPDQITSFEGYGCGGPLGEYYYYNTLVSKEISDKSGNGTSLQYLTCAKAVRDEGFLMLGGCNALVRAKDLYVVMLMKCMTLQMAGTINLSVYVAHIQNLRLTPMRRISYRALWYVCKRWDGRISYPDVG